MIISHQHRFIFLKTIKTAGTSLETFLSQACAETDVVTPFGEAVEAHKPRNFDGFYNHITADEVRRRVGEKIWRDYYKFCVVRNPWDKAISHYSMVKNSPRHQIDGNGDLTFDEYLEAGINCVDYPIYTEGTTEQVCVDSVARFESLDTDLQDIFRTLSIPFGGVLDIRAKGQFRIDRRHYRDVLTTAQAEQLSQIYSREIVLNGYAF